MSQANFMRNLRMSMPQVTNTTSFDDAVKILKNKGIITESFDITEKENDEYPTPPVASEEPNEDAEFDAILKQLEDEMGGDEAVKGQYDINESNVTKKQVLDTLERLFNENENRADIMGDVAKELNITKQELAKIIGLPNLYPDKPTMNETKETTNPNSIHPQEYTMGIRYELKCFKGDVVKAERAVLKNLAKEPFYYTALKLSGKDIYKEAPSVKAEAPKKKSKKKEAELVDTINAMQKVKMPKADGKKKIKENLEEVNPKIPAVNTPDEKNIEKLLPTYTTLINALKRENTIAELDGLFEIFLNATTLKAISKSAIIGALRSVLDRTQGPTFTSKLATKLAAPVTPITPSSTVSSKIFGGPNTGGMARGIKEVDTPQDDRVEAELASALSQQPTLKRILQKVDLPQEVNGTIKALLDRTNLKNIPDAIILAALRKILNDTPGSSFTAQYAINKNIGKPLPDLKEKLTSIVREMLAEKEEAPSKKKAAEEITVKAVDYIDDYNEGEKTYKKSQLEDVFGSYEDKVGHRFNDNVFEDVIDMLKAKGYTMTIKEMYDGRDNLTDISDDTK
jgi:hypothetical protein